MKYGNLSIVGEVRNNTVQGVSFVEVVATVYDTAGHVIATDSVHATMYHVQAGKKSPFRLTIPDCEGAATYKLQVQARAPTDLHDKILGQQVAGDVVSEKEIP